MKTLGISAFYHDSAVCLIIDGKIIAAAAEERFTRIKHDNNFPHRAIKYCLEEANISINDLDAIAFYEKPIWKFERLLSQHLEYFPLSIKVFLENTGSWLNQKLNVENIVKKELKYNGKIFFSPHHLSHAASAYYLSDFEDSVIVTVDGVGEWATTTVGRATKNKIKIDKEIRFPHSLGLLYSTLTGYLGFKVNDAEYKVMALAAYGDYKPFLKKFDQLIKMHKDGSYSLNMEYFDYGWAEHMPSAKMAKLFGYPIRKPESKIERHHENIAAALQYKTEQVVFNLLKKAHQEYKCDNLCMAGGVALNSVLNGKILTNTPFKKIYIPPAPSDAGGAMGAALYLDQNPELIGLKKNTKTTHLALAKNFTPYLGPAYSQDRILKAIKDSKLKYKLYKSEKDLLDFISDLIIDKKVIGWYQGRMEWGPRALGSRSILAAATSKDMKDILNLKVKKRELFRPFAPVILEKYAHEFFEADKPLPPLAKYMLLVYQFTKKGAKDIPSVVHVNGSGRLQSINCKENPLYYDLIDTYRKKTGVPVIINTSFNVRGEPIIDSPESAINCFLTTEIDCLVMDRYIVLK